MSFRIIKLKNTTGNDITIQGALIPAGDTYTIDNIDLVNYQQSQELFNNIASGDIVVNDGDNDITDSAKAWNYIIGKDQTPFSLGKLAIHESSRPLIENKRLGTYYIGVDDNLQTGEYLGDPDVAFITVGMSESSVTKDFEFDPQHGDVWIHEGYAWWAGAGDGDYFSVKIISNPTPVATSGVPLDYELDGNKIHYAAGGPGTGTHGFTGTPVPVFKPSSNGYWNLVNGSLQPAPSQDGEYDLYTVEVFVDYIIAKIPVLGTATNYVKFQSADTSQLPPGYKLRVELMNMSQSTWSIGFS